MIEIFWNRFTARVRAIDVMKPVNRCNAQAQLDRALDSQVLDDLERSVASPEFIRKLEQTRGCRHTPCGADELDAVLGEYVMVSKADAVEAMASYIAAWLSTVPEAKNMEPHQLQGAILGSIKVRRGVFRSVPVAHELPIAC